MKIDEILVVHHSHLDVGYTHTQPVLMELQREFLDEALRLLDHTADWADEASKPRWTIEVTAQLTKWLETVSEKDLQRFTDYAQAGRIGVSGMQYNSTPLTSMMLMVSPGPLLILLKIPVLSCSSWQSIFILEDQLITGHPFLTGEGLPVKQLK